MNIDDLFKKLNTDQAKDEKLDESPEYMCKYCSQESLIIDKGLYVCTSCGKEEGVVISDDQEWRTFLESGSKDNARCGMPSNPFFPNTLSTMVNTRHGIGNSLLQISMDSEKRGIMDICKTMKSVAKNLLISGNLGDKAAFLYLKVTANVKNLKRGGIRYALMAKCQYVICKQENNDSHVCAEKLIDEYRKFARSKKYKKNESVINFNEGSKLYHDLFFFQEQNKNNDTSIKKNPILKRKHDFTKPTEPENIIRPVCEKMGLTEDQIGKVVYMSRYIKKLSLLSSKMPQSIASGCIYLYCRISKIKENKKKISELCQKISELCLVSPETTNNTYNDLLKYENIIFPKKKEDTISGKFGNCTPKKQLSKIYTAPDNAFPQEKEIIEKNTNTLSISRGRPRKKL